VLGIDSTSNLTLSNITFDLIFDVNVTLPTTCDGTVDDLAVELGATMANFALDVDLSADSWIEAFVAVICLGISSCTDSIQSALEDYLETMLVDEVPAQLEVVLDDTLKYVVEEFLSSGSSSENASLCSHVRQADGASAAITSRGGRSNATLVSRDATSLDATSRDAGQQGATAASALRDLARTNRLSGLRLDAKWLGLTRDHASLPSPRGRQQRQRILPARQEGEGRPRRRDARTAEALVPTLL